MANEKTPPDVSRRQFVGTVAATAAGLTIVPRHVLGAGFQAPSDTVNVAVVGYAHGMGSNNLKNAMKSDNIVALCDVDDSAAAKQARARQGTTPDKFPRPPAEYKDFRVMLEKQKDIDAVIVATPDHMHAQVAMAAMQLGKHVYVQKPLTRTIGEARALTEAARKYKVVTQMGNQGHSFEAMRLLKEWLDDGAIGQVAEVHAWTDRPVGGDPWSDFAVRARPSETPPVPDTLDWDKWLGPAASRPYSPEYLPMKWRAWLDFGTGPLGDMGCHILDPAFWALELGPPLTVEATSTHYEPAVAAETYPRASIVRYTFPARDRKSVV